VIDQIAIGVCGLASVWLSQDERRNVQRYACLFGIVAQPFWFYATIKAGQWGIFVLTIFYTIGWLRGVRNYWFRAAV
jgi:hypothetical protein